MARTTAEIERRPTATARTADGDEARATTPRTVEQIVTVASCCAGHVRRRWEDGIPMWEMVWELSIAVKCFRQDSSVPPRAPDPRRAARGAPAAPQLHSGVRLPRMSHGAMAPGGDLWAAVVVSDGSNRRPPISRRTVRLLSEGNASCGAPSPLGAAIFVIRIGNTWALAGRLCRPRSTDQTPAGRRIAFVVRIRIRRSLGDRWASRPSAGSRRVPGPDRAGRCRPVTVPRRRSSGPHQRHSDDIGAAAVQA